MISLENFSIGYGNHFLLNEVSTSFHSGALTALLGRNGSGKSTLLKALCNLNNNYEGKIFIQKRDIKQLSRLELASLISFVNTTRPRIRNLKCKEVVALGRTPFTDWAGRLTNEDERIVADALESVGMKHFYNRDINTLSDGESQRIMIARAIAQNTDIIILDEPTSFLDLPTRFEIVGLLAQLAHEKNKTIIFSTHELDIAVEMADYISLIDSYKLVNESVGKILDSGILQKIFTMPGDYIERLIKMSKNGNRP